MRACAYHALAITALTACFCVINLQFPFAPNLWEAVAARRSCRRLCRGGGAARSLGNSILYIA